MEKRQLDFNAPLLSARRYSSPRNSSELAPRKPVEKRAPPVSSPPDPEPEDITKPGSVPFHWERSPGRPKYEPKARFPTTTTPKLPPGRVNSGELPKLPAHRLSGPSKFNSGPTWPTEQTIFSDHARLLEKLDESLKCRDDESSENSETEHDEEDDTYSDAINALSLNESCSVSGVSGSHGPSGTFSVDKQTRDFMMSRFLPAAKAVVVLETPQYVAKKPSVVGRKDEEVVKEVKKNFVSGEIITRPLVRKYGSAENIIPYYGRYGFDNGESEDDEEDEKIGRVLVKKPGKKWGIIPRICSVKSSMCLLNPLPAMKSKSRPPTPTSGDERRLRRSAVSGPLDKNGRQLTPPPRKKYHSGQLSRDLRGPHDTNNITNKSSIHDSSYPLLSSRDSPLRRYRSGSVSPYRNESPRSAFREGSGFLGVPKEIDPKIASSRKMFNALRDVSRNHAVEKTVYVDSVKKVVERRVGSKYTDYDEVKMDVTSVKASPLHPPLPKSPSESWLWRTLPSFGQSRRNSGELKGSSRGGDDAKWENIVKSSNLRHDHHARHLEELIPHVSYRQSKS